MPLVAANGIRIACDEVGDPKDPAILLLAPRPPATDREGIIREGMRIHRVTGSPGFPTSDDELRAELQRQIKVPALVIHGSDDPLVPVEAGKDTARRIPGAALKIIDGMAHDLPSAAIPTLVEAIAKYCRLADEPVALEADGSRP